MLTKQARDEYAVFLLNCTDLSFTKRHTTFTFEIVQIWDDSLHKVSIFFFWRNTFKQIRK